MGTGDWELGRKTSDSALSTHYSAPIIFDLLQERDNLQKMRWQELQQEIQIGLDSGEATVLDIQEIKAKARQSRP
jgi:hypothetical protein